METALHDLAASAQLNPWTRSLRAHQLKGLVTRRADSPAWAYDFEYYEPLTALPTRVRVTFDGSGSLSAEKLLALPVHHKAGPACTRATLGQLIGFDRRALLDAALVGKIAGAVQEEGLPLARVPGVWKYFTREDKVAQYVEQWRATVKWAGEHNLPINEITYAQVGVSFEPSDGSASDDGHDAPTAPPSYTDPEVAEHMRKTRKESRKASADHRRNLDEAKACKWDQLPQLLAKSQQQQQQQQRVRISLSGSDSGSDSDWAADSSSDVDIEPAWPPEATAALRKTQKRVAMLKAENGSLKRQLEQMRQDQPEQQQQRWPMRRQQQQQRQQRQQQQRQQKQPKRITPTCIGPPRTAV